MNKHSEILNLIKLIRESFPDAEKVYAQGSCVRFALILKKIYPQGDIYWNQDHAVFYLDNHYYDISGDISGERYNIKLEDWGIIEIHKVLQLRFGEPEKLNK